MLISTMDGFMYIKTSSFSGGKVLLGNTPFRFDHDVPIGTTL